MTARTDLQQVGSRKMQMATRVVPLLLFGTVALLTLIADAETTKTVFNPFTGKLDFITQVSTQNFQAGSGISVSCTSGVCTFTATGGAASSLQVTRSGVNITSPTASINLYSGDFISNAISGTTAQIALNPATTDFIQNTSSLQSGSTFYTSSGTVQSSFIVGTPGGQYSFTPGSSNNMTLDISTQTNVVNANGTTQLTLYPPGGNVSSINTQTTPLVFVSSGNISAGKGRLYFIDTPATHHNSFRSSGTITTSADWVLPAADALGYLKSDGNQNLSFDNVFNDTNTWTGQQVWASPQPSTFTFSVNVGSVTGGGLSTCGDATHALGYNGSNQFTCQSVTGSASAAIGFSSGSATTSVVVTSPTTNIVADSNTFVVSLQGSSTSFFKVNAASVTEQGNVFNGVSQLVQLNSSGLVPNTLIDGSSITKQGQNVGVLSATQTWTGQNNWTTPSQSTFTYGLTVGSFTVNGSSAGSINLTEGAVGGAPSAASSHDIFWADSSSHAVSGNFNASASTYTLISSSWNPVANQYLFWVANGPNSWIVGSTATAGSGGGGGTPASPTNSVQYNNAGAFGGSSNFQFNGTSITVVSSVTIRDSGPNQGSTPGMVDIFANSGGKTLLTLGTTNGNNQVVVADQTSTKLTYGASPGNLLLGGNAFPDRISDFNGVGTSQYIDFSGGSGSNNTVFQTAVGAGNFIFQPAGNKEVVISTLGITISTTVTNTSSETITGASGLGVTYNINAGSMTGAGLTNCGDSTHALSWTSSTGLFGCQNIPGSGGGSSAMAFAIGSTTSWKTSISSPTAALVADQSQFYGQLLGSTTGFFSLAEATTTVTGNYTTTSTDTVIMANCSSACTITLSTSATIANKVLTVGQLGTANVTLSPAAGNISGGSTALMNQQYTFLDVKFDGTNWFVK